MDEERPRVEKLKTVKLLPLVSAGPSLIALFRQRVRRRGQTENVKNQGLVVAQPSILDESAFGFPPMRDSIHASGAVPLRTPVDSAVLRPLPVGPGVDCVRKRANLLLVFGVAVEILSGG